MLLVETWPSSGSYVLSLNVTTKIGVNVHYPR